MIDALNERSKTIFRTIVDCYLETGEPVGSRTLSRISGLSLSPASIRNCMADLEDMGLLYAPHTSAGRLPTDHGLRLYVDGLMEIGSLSSEERHNIELSCKAAGLPVTDVLRQTGNLLSGLSSCASLVIAPGVEENIRQIQFLLLAPGKALVILVMHNGMIENRLMDIPADLPPSALISASNYLNDRLSGRSVDETIKQVKAEIKADKTRLDALTQNLVAQGIADILSAGRRHPGHIIVRGQSSLLRDVKAIEDLERARTVLSRLEEHETMLGLLGAVSEAQGVQIYIGSENKIFNQSGWSMIISPYRGEDQKIIGAIGVIGPTRLDYDRIIPMVDYTSQVVSRFLQKI